MGHTGTGKTTLGYMVAAAATRAQHYGSQLQRGRAAEPHQGRRSTPTAAKRTDEVIETLANVDLLHIEDLRVVRPTEWVLEQLYLIVNARYEGQRSIVFTSDIDSDADGPLAPEPSEARGAHRQTHLLAADGDLQRPGLDRRSGQSGGEP